MSSFNIEERLEESISSVFYKVTYVSYYIHKAQVSFEHDDDAAALDALESAACLLEEAGEDWAAEKVRYYKRFI